MGGNPWRFFCQRDRETHARNNIRGRPRDKGYEHGDNQKIGYKTVCKAKRGGEVRESRQNRGGYKHKKQERKAHWGNV